MNISHDVGYQFFCIITINRPQVYGITWLFLLNRAGGRLRDASFRVPFSVEDD